MTHDRERRPQSPIVGSLRLPEVTGDGTPDPDEPVAVLIEINLRYPGGLRAVREAFYVAWEPFAAAPGGTGPDAPTPPDALDPPLPAGLHLISPKLYQCVLSRAALRSLVDRDAALAAERPSPPSIFRAWPDYILEAQIDRSAPTVKADAAWRSYGASGNGVVWAVVDSGIDGRHPHFAELELAAEAWGRPTVAGRTTNLHRDFSFLVHLGRSVADAVGQDVDPGVPGQPPAALTDVSGHGTHVAGIIAGCAPDGAPVRVAESREPTGDSGYVPRLRTGRLSGMAPGCELISLKVMRCSPQGTWITSSAAVIRALTYLRTEVNVDPGLLRVHGVNLSLGCGWDPKDYAAGQSPLSQALNQVVASGIVAVVSAGNSGARLDAGDPSSSFAVLGSITEPAHAENCIAVGSTHREAPHTFGVTWTSSKGPTLDGRMKPDVVAPGEWIASAATGEVRAAAGFEEPTAAPAGDDATYAELSGTSMAAPHVSGVIAAFLSARPEFIGRPDQVKDLLTSSATDLGRERYAQGAGLVDLMRMLSNV